MASSDGDQSRINAPSLCIIQRPACLCCSAGRIWSWYVVSDDAYFMLQTSPSPTTKALLHLTWPTGRVIPTLGSSSRPYVGQSGHSFAYLPQWKTNGQLRLLLPQRKLFLMPKSVAKTQRRMPLKLSKYKEVVVDV